MNYITDPFKRAGNPAKILSVLLCGLVMAGCAANKTAETDNSETEVTSSVETTPAETTAAVTSATTEAPVTTVTEDKNKVIFTNPKEPEDPVVFKGEGKKLLMYEKGEKIAEVISDHEVEAAPEVRCEDFNFDGHRDLILYDTPSDYRHYGGECWLWDKKKGEYVKTDKLDGLLGYGIDIDTNFFKERILIEYTEHYDYAESFICRAEFEWVNDNIVPVSLKKTAYDIDPTYVPIDEDHNFRRYIYIPEDIDQVFRRYIIDEIYEFDQKKQPVLKSRTRTEQIGHEGKTGNTEKDDDLYYFRTTYDSVQYMKGDSVVQNIPLKNGPELIAQYRMRKLRGSDYPLYFNDLIFSMDYDYDGYKDLCVTTGVNEYGMADKFIYYHYDPSTGMFNEWDELNNVFEGQWICSEESHRFRPFDKYYDYNLREEYSKLSCDKYIPTGSGEYRETRWYVWNNGKLEPDNTDVSFQPLSITDSEFMINAGVDRLVQTSQSISTGNPGPPKTDEGGWEYCVSFEETEGLFSAESVDDVKTIHGYLYDRFSVIDAIKEMTYIPDGYSYEIREGNLVIKTPQVSQTITEDNFEWIEKVVYADFNFDGYADFYTCNANYNKGCYFLWDSEKGSFKQSKELEFEGESYFLKPDYGNKTLTALFSKYNDNGKESVTLRWEENKLVPVAAVFMECRRVSGHVIAKKCHYKYDDNYDMILTGTEETIYGVCNRYCRIPLVYRKKEFEDSGDEKYFRFTDNALQYMKGNSIIQSMSYSDIFGTELIPVTENFIPGDYFSKNRFNYAEWDIDFDGTDDLCIYGYIKQSAEEYPRSFYSYYLFDKSTGMYRKWNSISEKGYLYLPDYQEKILYYKTRFYNGDDDVKTYNYHKWENEQDVIYKQVVED